jgi:DNA-binding NarL/FixJ family response regulator
MPSKYRVAVVDDHPLLRQGIGAIINADRRFQVCVEIEDAKRVIEQVGKAKPDVLILDITLKNANGIEVLKDVRVQFPQLPVLMLSMHDENLYAPRTLRAGARGYLNKSEAADKLLEALTKILKGEIYLSEKMAAQMLQQVATGRPASSSPLEILSDRELQVLQLIGDGFGTRDIAGKLGVSIKTIETHRAHLKEKLKFNTSTELIRYAVQWATKESGEPSVEMD